MPTRVAAEGQFPSGRVGVSDVEIPVFVDTHCGSVCVPAGVGKQEVLKTRQHLRWGTENSQMELRFNLQYGIPVSEEMTGICVNVTLIKMNYKHLSQYLSTIIHVMTRFRVSGLGWGVSNMKKVPTEHP